jgi:hypothetical protein
VSSENITIPAHDLFSDVFTGRNSLAVKNKSKAKLMAYAARIALETGADLVKLNYHGSPKDLAWAVKSAGRCKVQFSAQMFSYCLPVPIGFIRLLL